MGTLTINATNGQTVAAGATYTVSYPAGKSADDYLTTGAKITTSDGSIYSATVSLGGSGITITNPTGRAIASGGFDYLDLDNAGIVARFNSLGEGAVLLGPKNTEASLVSSENNLLTGGIDLVAGAQSAPLQKYAPVVAKKLFDFSGFDQTNNAIIMNGVGMTGVLDTASPFGKPALKLSNITAQSFVEINKFAIPSFSGHVVWRVWVEDYAKVSHCRVFVGTAALAAYSRHEHDLYLSTYALHNGIHHFVGGPNYLQDVSGFTYGTSTFGDTRLEINPIAGQTIANIWIDAVEIAPRLRKGVIAFTFDDGHASWITNLLPALQSSGIKATFNITHNIIGTANWCTVADLQTLAADGHQLCGHQEANSKYQITYNGGTSGTQTKAQYTTDFVTNAKWLSSTVGISPEQQTYMSWVQGASDGALCDVINGMGIRLGRMTQPARYQVVSCGLGAYERMMLATVRLEPATTLAAAKLQVDYAADYGQLAVFMGHEIVDGTPTGTQWNTQDMADLLAYAASKATVETVTANGLYTALNGYGLLR